MTRSMKKFAAAATALIAVLSLSAFAPQAHAAALTVQTKTPTPGSTFGGIIVWEASVSGGTPTRVEFLIDGALKWTEGAAPYRYNGDTGTLDTRTLSDGTHTFTVRAFASTGQAYTSNSTMTIANRAPSLAVTTSTPAANTTLSGNVVWEAKMTAGTASRIDFIIDGTQKWSEGIAPYRFNGDTGSLDTRALGNGSHTLTARAVD
jgi:hypothetical protein